MNDGCVGGDDGGGDESEQERHQRGDLCQERGGHRLPRRRLARDVARPVAEERTERDGIRHDDQRSADEGRPEQRVGRGVGVRTEDARVAGIERAGEGEDAEQEEHGGGDDGDLVDQQHESESVDADDENQQREDAVGDRDGEVVVRQADCAVGATDEDVAGGPHRDREERDGGQQRQKGSDDAAVHAEVRRRGHRVVGAVARAEQRHRRQDRRAEHAARAGSPAARRGTTARR